MLFVVTGASGSGKTTLSIDETVDRISEWVREEREKRRELTQGRHA